MFSSCLSLVVGYLKKKKEKRKKESLVGGFICLFANDLSKHFIFGFFVLVM